MKVADKKRRGPVAFLRATFVGCPFSKDFNDNCCKDSCRQM